MIDCMRWIIVAVTLLLFVRPVWGAEDGSAGVGQPDRTMSELARKLDSADNRQREDAIGDILVGKVKYDSKVGDLLVSMYSTETNSAVRLGILAILQKHEHPAVSGLLDKAGQTGSPEERKIVELIRSGSFSNVETWVNSDPGLIDRPLKRKLRDLSTLSPDDWLRALHVLGYDAKGYGYDTKMGDALVEFYHKPPGDAYDQYQIRVGILYVLQNQNHPMFPKLLDDLKKSTNPDDQELARNLELKQKERTAPQK